MDQLFRTLNFKIERTISTGPHAVVLIATHIDTGQLFAIKKYLKTINILSREMRVLEILGEHPNIVKFFTVFYSHDDNNKIYKNIVFEYVPKSLESILKENLLKNKSFDVQKIVKIMWGILSALSHMNSIGIVHRNINPDNILLDSNLGEAKICNFRMAKFLQQRNNPMIGSLLYNSPECLLGVKEYTSTVDIWAAGCVLVELYHGKPLFDGKKLCNLTKEQIPSRILRKQVKICNPPFYIIENYSNINVLSFNYLEELRKITTKKPLSYYFHRKPMSLEAQNLAEKMLAFNPYDRPLALECMGHQFFYNS